MSEKQERGKPQLPYPPIEERVCEYCHGVFYGPPWAAYCSNAHRQAAYRQRKAEREQKQAGDQEIVNP